MTEGPQQPMRLHPLPYAARIPAGEQSIRPSAFLFAVTFYTLSVGMIYTGEAFLGAPRSEYGAAADAMIMALLVAPFSLLSLVTFAVTARATAAKVALPAVAAIEGAICGTIIAILLFVGNALSDRTLIDILMVAVAVISPIIGARIMGFLNRRALSPETDA